MSTRFTLEVVDGATVMSLSAPCSAVDANALMELAEKAASPAQAPDSPDAPGKTQIGLSPKPLILQFLGECNKYTHRSVGAVVKATGLDEQVVRDALDELEVNLDVDRLDVCGRAFYASL